MDWEIDRNWSWPIAGCGGFRWVAASCWFCGTARSLEKTYDSRTWSRPKSDPTMQMQISMHMQVQIRMQTQFDAIFASVLQKSAPRSSGKHIFANKLWAIGLQKSTFWSIEGFTWGLIGPSFRYLWLSNFFFRRFSASVAHPNFEKSSAKRITFAHGAVPNRIRPCKCKF